MPAAETVLNGAYAKLPGVKLWFTDTGGSGVPIVLLHPNTGTVEIWQPQIAAFAAAGYRVIAFDRKGWGKSVADPASGPQPAALPTISMRLSIISSSTSSTCSALPAAASWRSTTRRGVRKSCAA